MYGKFGWKDSMRGLNNDAYTKTNAEYFLGEPSMKMFRKKLSDYEAVWMGREIRKGKLASFQKEFLEEVSREPVLLLLEADGAKHFPVKAPAEHEPRSVRKRA